MIVEGIDFRSFEGDYIIFGAGGLARELWGWIKYSQAKENGSKRLLAFIDETISEPSSYDEIPVIPPKKLDGRTPPYILAVGGAHDREKISERLAKLDLEPLTYIHESALHGVQVRVGRGSVVCPRTSLSSDSQIGDFVLVNGGSAVAHDVKIGRYSSLLGNAVINGRVQIGERVTIGAGAIIHPGRRIGDGATVGMGSVVFSHVKAGSTVVGNPARIFSNHNG